VQVAVERGGSSKKEPKLPQRRSLSHEIKRGRRGRKREVRERFPREIPTAVAAGPWGRGDAGFVIHEGHFGRALLLVQARGAGALLSAESARGKMIGMQKKRFQTSSSRPLLL
jgi:hypothetical protein